MKHLSTSTTIRKIESQAHMNLARSKFLYIEEIFKEYIAKNRPNAPGYIYVPSFNDTCRAVNPYEFSFKNSRVEKFLNKHKWAYKNFIDFYISDEIVKEIIEIWTEKYSDIKITWETITFNTPKFLWFGKGKPFTVKMWKIEWL